MWFLGGIALQCNKTGLRTDDEPPFRFVYTVTNLQEPEKQVEQWLTFTNSMKISVNAPHRKKSCRENVFWQQRAVKANQSRSTVQSFVYGAEWRKEGKRRSGGALFSQIQLSHVYDSDHAKRDAVASSPKWVLHWIKTARYAQNGCYILLLLYHSGLETGMATRQVRRQSM